MAKKVAERCQNGLKIVKVQTQFHSRLLVKNFIHFVCAFLQSLKKGRPTQAIYLSLLMAKYSEMKISL